MRAARVRGARIAALVNVEGSTLWRLADYALPLGAGPERCVLATKSFTAKVAIVLMTAYELVGQLGEGARLVRGAGEEIERLLADDRRDLIRQIANQIYQREHLYVIGRDPSYPLALEAVLKVKEVSYVHAEGFAGGELKHGVIALIERGTPCLVLAPCDETYVDVISGAMQMKARGAMNHRRLAGVARGFRRLHPRGGSRTSGGHRQCRPRPAPGLLSGPLTRPRSGQAAQPR